MTDTHDQHLRDSLDASGDAMLLVDATNHILHANAAAARLWGRAASDLTGVELGLPASHRGVAELDVIRPGGESLIVEVREVPALYRGARAAVLLVNDVTRARRDAQALRLSAAMVEGVMDALSAAAVLLDTELRVLAANGEWQALSPTAGPGAPWTAALRAVCDADEAQVTMAASGVEAVINAECGVFTLELGRPDESPWVIRATPVRRGNLLGAVVTHRRFADRELRPDSIASHQHDASFRAVFDRSYDAMLLVDNAGAVVGANAAARTLLGVPPTGGGVTFGSLLAELPDDHRPADAWQSLMADGQWRREVELAAPGGQRVVDVSAAAHVMPGRHVLTLRDVTDARRIEGQLRQSQKMEAIGLLTGGLAHDFNNLLTVVLANADLVLESLPPDMTETRDEMSQVVEAARRGSDMIRKLLAFSRRESIEKRSLAIETLLAETQALLSRVLPESITVRADADPELPAVFADPGAVQHMLLNLATNARDAMPAGGTLSMRATLSPSVELPSGGRAPMMSLVVSDTGMGMTDEAKAHLFEPFFTTKAPGEGTGLGMAMIYGLVQQHDGAITVESEGGRGTTVTIHLPLAESATHAYTPRSVPAVLGGGTETVLLVEDEEMVRRAGRRILEKHGYRVLLASDGAEALDLLHRQGEDVAIVVSDVVMPRMGGRELYESLRAAGFRMPFLFTSGYTDRMASEAAALDPSIPVLPKPWTWHELTASVRAALDERRTS